MLIVALWTSREVTAQETPPLLKVDLVVPANVGDEAGRPTDLCVFLPDDASTVKVSRRPLGSEAGGSRPLWMSIMPYISTADPYVEKVNVMGDTTLTIPELGAETCFTFANMVFPR